MSSSIQAQPDILVIEPVEHASISYMLQDSAGFLWFRSENLPTEVFDGYEFIPERQLWPELSPHSVRATVVDKDGTRWLGGEGLLARTAGFYGNLELFGRQFPDSTVTVYRLLKDRDGRMWVGSRTGLSRFDPDTQTFVHFRHDPTDPTSISEDHVYDIVQDRNGRIWAGTANGVSRLDVSETGTFSRFMLDGVRQAYRDSRKTLTGLNESRIEGNRLLIDDAGSVWVVCSIPRSWTQYGTLVWGAGQVARFNESSNTFEPLYLGDEVFARSIVQGPTGRVWVGTSRGLYSIDPSTNEVRTHTLKTPQGATRPPESLDIYLDNKDVLWLFDREGIAKLDLQNPFPVFETHGHDPTRTDGLSANWIDAIVPNDDGTVWIGTGQPEWSQGEGGLSLFNRATNTYVHYKHNPEDEATLSSNLIYELLRTRDGELWVGTRHGLNLFDPATGTATRYYFGDDTLRALPPAWQQRTLDLNDVHTLYELENGDLWIGTNAGLVRLDRRRLALQHEFHDSYVGPVLELERGSALIGAEGLYLLDEPHQEPQLIWPDADRPIIAPITDLLRARSGYVWATTFHGGLLRYDPSSRQVTAFDKGNGFPSNYTLCVLEDDGGSLWVSTFSGLVQFDPVTRRSVTYSQSDGTLNRRFAGGSCARAPSGELLFGGEFGLTIVDPSAANANLNPPDIWITSLTVGDATLRPGIDSRLRRPIASAGTIELAHDQNNISIYYTGLHFDKPKDLRYEYRFPTLGPDWRSVGSRREARFTNLDPGNYTFEVRVWNGRVKSQRTATVSFHILPAWWTTWWALFLFMVTLGAVVFLGSELRIRRLRSTAEKLQHEVHTRTSELRDEKQKTELQAQRLIELDRAKNRFFANISHEFRTPLTLIIGPLQDAIQGLHADEPRWLQTQLALMMGNAKRLLTLINQLLDLSRLESGKLELYRSPGDLVNHLRILKEGFAPAAERHGLRLVFESNRKVLPCLYDADVVEKAFYNLLGNAMKFTPAGGKILIGLDATEVGGKPTVEITIQDTGRGIAPEHLVRIFDRFEQVDASNRRAFEGSGIGLALVKELVELHGGTVHVESKLGFGSTFTVSLPLEEVSPDLISEGSSEEHLEDTAESLDLDPPVLVEEPQIENRNRSESVLIVEDNADVRRYLRDHLAAAYKIIEAENGSQGLELAKDLAPSLILTDIMMPVMDGYEMVERIRSRDSIAHIPIIMLTARADEGEAADAINAGADDYLAKPFDVDELKARVDRLIHRRRALREQFSREVVIKGSDVVVTSADAVFVEKVTEAVDENLGDPQFGSDWLADEVGLSRRQLERRLESTLGEAPGALIRRLRLERASQLLRAQAGTVSEIAYSVGFTSPANFTRAFRKAYGQSPTEHARSASSDLAD